MTVTSLYESVGGTSFPFTASSVDNTKLTLEPLDPLADAIADLLKAAINAELSAAWTKVTNALGAAHPLYGTLPVQDTLPDEPEEEAVEERKCRFPLLAVHRVGKATYSRFSLTRLARTQQWNVHHIFGNCDVAARRKLKKVWEVGAPSIVALTLDRQSHPSYLSGAKQFENTVASMSLEDSESGQAAFSPNENTKFYSCLMTLKVVEISDMVDGGGEEYLEGTELAVDLHNEGESEDEIKRFVVADSDPDWPGGT